MDLYLFNSLTNSLGKFDHDKSVPIKWYTCGPTIYSSAHLGHARTFTSFNIIRRILTYLGYTIIYVMNITDIDDKIINKVKALNNDVMNRDIYMQFISKMETEFFNDMDKLNVLRPTVVTRVTEYIDKIIKYIEQMESNGLTYVVNGTVYIDSQIYLNKGYDWDIFHRASDTDYTECDFVDEKKHKRDFSLWKASKPGEINFPSPWGLGRPSWHIECSVMSENIFGKEIHIHSGGVDLIYPHHANEIIQSIAHQNCNKNPIQYFLHSGHLNINGEKMAKSLNNFITIDDFLTHHTARQLRLLFLLHKWDKFMDFTDDVVTEIKTIEKKITTFYANVAYLNRTFKNVNSYGENDQQYLTLVIQMKKDILVALYNNMDTRTMMLIILEMINKTFKYVTGDYNLSFVNDMVNHMTEILNVVGVTFNNIDMIDNSDKYIDIIVSMREEVRKIIKSNTLIPKTVTKDLFTLLDQVRDVQLKPNGIMIEDGDKPKWTKI